MPSTNCLRRHECTNYAWRLPALFMQANLIFRVAVGQMRAFVVAFGDGPDRYTQEVHHVF